MGCEWVLGNFVNASLLPLPPLYVRAVLVLYSLLCCPFRFDPPARLLFCHDFATVSAVAVVISENMGSFANHMCLFDAVWWWCRIFET